MLTNPATAATQDRPETRRRRSRSKRTRRAAARLRDSPASPRRADRTSRRRPGGHTIARRIMHVRALESRGEQIVDRACGQAMRRARPCRAARRRPPQSRGVALAACRAWRAKCASCQPAHPGRAARPASDDVRIACAPDELARGTALTWQLMTTRTPPRPCAGTAQRARPMSAALTACATQRPPATTMTESVRLGTRRWRRAIARVAADATDR